MPVALSDNALQFLESNKEVYKEKEFKELCETVKLSQKDTSIEYIKNYY